LPLLLSLSHTIGHQLTRFGAQGGKRGQLGEFKFGDRLSPGVSVSADRLAVTNQAIGWKGAMLEPAISTAERAYVEWLIEEPGANCHIMLGVTALDALPPGDLCIKRSSRMFCCHNSKAYPGAIDWGASGRRAAGDRVGLLVHEGRLSVYLNGERLGPGPMAGDLPGPLVRFCVEMGEAGSRVRVVAGARPPPGV
jgi:hypothetical protein